MKTYTAVATRDGRFWLVHIPELDKYTQARNLSEVEPMARDLVALLLDVPEDSFQLSTKVELPAGVRDHITLAMKYRSEAAQAQSQAASEYRAAANELKADGLTIRDIGKALGISHQRAQQLVG